MLGTVRVLIVADHPIMSDGLRGTFLLDPSVVVVCEARDIPQLLRDLPHCSPDVALVDLQLSGPSHGGQVRVPFVGPLWLPDLGKRYVWGLYKICRLTLYTNPGLGTVGSPVRMNCPPEITFLTVRRSVG